LERSDNVVDGGHAFAGLKRGYTHPLAHARSHHPIKPKPFVSAVRPLGPDARSGF
jgi:hypothetical protein